MNIHKNISLQAYNTFGIEQKAALLIEAYDTKDILEALHSYPDLIVLGGGSNILLTQEIQTPILKIMQKGISVEKETDSHVWIKAQAGEVWSDFVDSCVARGYGGLENLSLIYGTVGAAPVQNIGAYGVELKDVLSSCEVLDRESGQTMTLLKENCLFGYRDSLFKQQKGRYIILSATFCQTKRDHLFKTHYGDIRALLQEKGWGETPELISKVIKEIRLSKLPNPTELGNSGSFFKNPVIPREQFLSLQERYPTIPHFEISAEEVKVPAAFLIETCELKGFRIDKVGVHHRQPLVLVNFGGATGEEVLALARHIQKRVLNRFGIQLEMEVNVW